MRTYVSLLLGALSFNLVISQAQARPDQIWINSNGLVKAEMCQDKLADQIPFRVTEYYSSQGHQKDHEALRSRSGKSQYHIPNYSLVRVVKENGDRLQIEVIGSSANEAYKHNRYTAERNYGSPYAPNKKAKQNLYLYHLSAKDLENYVFEVRQKQSPVLKNSFIKIAKEAQKFNVSNCCLGKECKDYYIFNVFSQDKKFIQKIGISNEATGLFSKMTGYAYEGEALKAEDQIEKIVKPPISSQKSSDPSQNGPQIKTQKKPKEIKKDQMDTTPVVVEGFFESVICLSSHSATLNVRDENLSKTLFTLDNGSKIKIFQSFDEKKKKVGNTTYDFVKIQNAEDSKIGWVAKKFISQSANCDGTESEKPDNENTEKSSTPEKSSTTSSDKTGQFMAEGTYTVCTEGGGSLSVYDEKFNKLTSRFFLESGEKAVVIDGALRNKPTPNGYQYVKVRTESSYIRYVAKDFLTKEKCKNALSQEGGKAAGGYIFPTMTKTGYSYISRSQRSYQHSSFTRFSGYRGNWGVYGAGRSRGRRAHAATDLYQPFGLKVPNKHYSKRKFGGAFRAMTNGRVVRGSTPFYLGTNYIVIHHNDGVVSRYGEIYPGTLYKKSQVTTGQVLGYIKWVGAGGVPPMLHFENYYPKSRDIKRGILGGAKRINGRNSQRSSHLFNRTNFMRKLEANTFK